MSFSAVITTAWLLSAGGVDPATGKPMDEMTQGIAGEVITLTWRDAEDHLDGFVSPLQPVEGRPFDISVRVRRLEGSENYTGPVVMTLRRAGEEHGSSATVAPTGERWKHSFTVENAGDYRLDISFRTTRMKVVRTNLSIRSDMTVGGLPLSTLGLAAVALFGLAAIGFAVARMLGARKSAPG